MSQQQQQDEERRRQAESLHPECEDRCQIAEHKGYASCQSLGIACQALESGRNHVIGCHPKSWKTYLPQPSYSGVGDTAVDGRPLMVSTGSGPVPFDVYCKPHGDSK